MKSAVGWLAIGIVSLLFIFILKRIVSLILKGREKRRFAIRTPSHDALADAAEDIAEASRIASFIAHLGAFLAAPAGIMAVGAMLGLVSTPLVVRMAPILMMFATGAAALSAAAKLYLKRRRRLASARANSVHQDRDL